MSILKAKKSLGQHFLQDVFYLDKITDAVIKLQDILNIDVGTRPKVIEIGAGLGDLTQRLLDKAGSLVTYEIDGRLISTLNNKFGGRDVDLRHLDVLTINKPHGWLYDNPYILVSNLPYYAASSMIMRGLKDDRCLALVVMTQKEVARRFYKERSPLSICLSNRSKETRFISAVPKSAFNPPPKVESEIFSIRKNMNYSKHLEAYEAMVRRAFQHPRKTLSNNLGINVEALGLDKRIRAHELDSEDYWKIFHTFFKKST